MRILRVVQDMLPSLFIMVAASIMVSFFLGFDTFEGCLATAIMTLAPTFIEKYRALPPEPEARSTGLNSAKPSLPSENLSPGPSKTVPERPRPRPGRQPDSAKRDFFQRRWVYVLLSLIILGILYARYIF